MVLYNRAVLPERVRNIQSEAYVLEVSGLFLFCDDLQIFADYFSE
jgi:hypothetical protein